MPKQIAIVILAAGSSSRMGTAKQLLPVKKTTLLGIIIQNALESESDTVLCVLGANANDVQSSIEKYDVEIIINSNYKTGLSSSIMEGIQYLKHKNFDAVLIMLGDQPFVNFNYLNELIKEFKTTPEKIVATSYHNSLGVPAIIPQTYFENLMQLKGDKGAKEFLNSHSETIISFKSDSLFDVDTEEDYKELMKKLNQ